MIIIEAIMSLTERAKQQAESLFLSLNVIHFILNIWFHSYEPFGHLKHTPNYLSFYHGTENHALLIWWSTFFFPIFCCCKSSNVIVFFFRGRKKLFVFYAMSMKILIKITKSTGYVMSYFWIFRLKQMHEKMFRQSLHNLNVKLINSNCMKVL